MPREPPVIKTRFPVKSMINSFCQMNNRIDDIGTDCKSCPQRGGGVQKNGEAIF
jgi:hypothetical protein